MGQDPNQPYSSPYGQPPAGGVPPQSGEYYQGYGQQPSAPGYQPPSAPGYQPPSAPGYQPPAPGYQPPVSGYQQPYQQAGYQQYGQQGPYNTASPLGPTTINMEPNTAAGLSYLTWIAGLIFFLVEKQNRFVRFNAMQELLLTGVAVALGIVVNIVSTILAFAVPVLGIVIGFLAWIVWIGLFVFWLIAIINAFQGKYYKIPVIGDYAERWSAPAPGVPGAPGAPGAPRL